MSSSSVQQAAKVIPCSNNSTNINKSDGFKMSNNGGGQRRCNNGRPQTNNNNVSNNTYKRAPRFQRRQSLGSAKEKLSMSVLNTDQVNRLYAIMQEPLEVHGRGNFPTLFICLRRFIRCVIRRLEERGLKVKRVKLNGGAASYVLATKTLPSYNDIDLIFDVDISSNLGVNSHHGAASFASHGSTSIVTQFDLIKHSIFDALIEFLPSGVNRTKMCAGAMKSAYVRKMVKVCDVHPGAKAAHDNPSKTVAGDLWSLISLNNDQGRFLELKFVERMRRQFEFSVDSFQIDLDPVIRRDRPRSFDDDSVASSLTPPSDDIIVAAESMYGDFQLALKHLDQMLIDTVQPELIRGGGLLKYVNLLVRGFKPARPIRQCSRMERYMCSRFFIDFGSCDEQQRKLRDYLDNHFRDDPTAKYDFMLVLRRVVDESTVCLPNHELRMSLDIIDQLAFEVHVELCYARQLQAFQEVYSAWNLMTPVCSSSCSSSSVISSDLSEGYDNSNAGTLNYCSLCRSPSSTVATTAAATTEKTSLDGSDRCSAVSSPPPSSAAELHLPPPPPQPPSDDNAGCGDCRCPSTTPVDGRRLVVSSPVGSATQQPGVAAPTSKPTLMFIPHNASYWIPVI